MEEGIADRETINRAYSLGSGLPIGIFDVGDLISFDTMKGVLDELYEKYSNDLFKPTDPFIKEVG